jgi:Concanavalin A-like lectin/glucanases superfamily
MTQAIWVILGVLAVPMVLLLATTGCSLDVRGIPTESVGKTSPVEPQPTYEQTVLDTASLVGYWRLGEKNAVLTTQEPKAVNSFWPGNLDGVYVTLTPAGITLEEEGALENDPDTAAQFAGTPTGGFVDVPSVPNGDLTPLTGGEVTVELWAKLPDLPNPVPDWALLVGCYEPPDDTMTKGYRLRVRTVSDPAQIEIQANIGGMPAPLIGQVPIDVDAPTDWHHVVLTSLKASDQQPAKAELYIDGKLFGPVVAGTTEIFDVATTQSLRFAGGYSVEIGKVTDPYPGWLDEVALYLNHLDPAEVDKHFKAKLNAVGS